MDYLAALNAVKNQIKDKASILDVVGKYVTLVRKGEQYKGLCPFHADSKPSLTVSTKFDNYRCWACGETGDIFTFVQKTEGLTFMEAIESLAERFGVPYQRRGITEEALSERQISLGIIARAEEYFIKNLGPYQRGYLYSRGVSDESITKWGIGYAPGFLESQLWPVLMGCQLTRSQIIQAGLARPEQPDGMLGDDSNGRLYPIFQNRIMFPIRDIHGTTIGFGGRAMGDAQPKYINSPQSAVFNKSAVLYGVDQVRNKRSDHMVIVEGYLDVILVHQGYRPGYGWTSNAVAPMGTALTDQHAKLIAPIAQKIVLAYDDDTAGHAAVIKSSAVLEPYGLSVHVAQIADGLDPADVVNHNPLIWHNLCINAVDRVQFEIDLVMKRITDSNVGRTEALRDIIPILATVENSVDLGNHVNNVAPMHPLYSTSYQKAVEGILRDVQQCRWKVRQAAHVKPVQRPTKPDKPAVDMPAAVPASRAVRYERAVLTSMFYPELRRTTVFSLNPQHLITPEALFLYSEMLRFPVLESGALDPGSFQEHIRVKCSESAPVVIQTLGIVLDGLGGFIRPTAEISLADVRECIDALAAIHADMVARLAGVSIASELSVN